MKKFALLLALATMWFFSASDASAQIAYVTYYQPTTVLSPVVAPPCAAPHAVYYAPAPAAVAYQPVARYRTRYRPFLGGTVTRVRYGYAPTVVAPVVYAY